MSGPRTGNAGPRQPRAAGGRRPGASGTTQDKPNSGDDLTSIAGLLGKHRKVLAEQLQINTYAALAGAEPRAIFGAMFRIRPRPTLEQIREWQRIARHGDGEAVAEPPAWERAATFVLSFERRLVEGRLEKQLVAEHTELELEQTAASWPTWDCSEVCDWLQHRLDDAGALGQAEKAQPKAARTGDAPAARPGQRPSAAGVTSGRGQLRIDLAAIVDAAGRAEIVSGGTLIAQTVKCAVPGRLEVTIAGAEPDREVRVALRFQRPGQPGWSPHEPITMSGGGTAELDLSDVAAGKYEARILAWTPDASAEPTAAELGTLSIGMP